MKIYADTSALIAWFHPADEFAPAVTAWCRARSPDFCWNPLLRMELRRIEAVPIRRIRHRWRIVPASGRTVSNFSERV